jgi:hypothetical protein
VPLPLPLLLLLLPLPPLLLLPLLPLPLIVFRYFQYIQHQTVALVVLSRTSQV